VPKASRHPEVDQERATAVEPKNQILAAPLDGGDGLALELGSDLERLERADEPRVEDVDVLEAPPDERGLELAANRLDLGQLGHTASVATSSGSRSRVTPPGLAHAAVWGRGPLAAFSRRTA
jgi:hypothetical protein